MTNVKSDGTSKGTINNPMLYLENKRTGSGARALWLQVAPGVSPVRVNANAGKATNWNADKLDGARLERLPACRIRRHYPGWTGCCPPRRRELARCQVA